MHRLVKIKRPLTNLRWGGRHIVSVFSESLSATGDNIRPSVGLGLMKYPVTTRPNGRSAKSDTGRRRHLLITAEIFEQSCWYEVCLQSLCRPKQSSPLTTMSAFISLSSIVWDQMSRQLAQRNLTQMSHVIYSFNKNHNKRVTPTIFICLFVFYVADSG